MDRSRESLVRKKIYLVLHQDMCDKSSQMCVYPEHAGLPATPLFGDADAWAPFETNPSGTPGFSLQKH